MKTKNISAFGLLLLIAMLCCTLVFSWDVSMPLGREDATAELALPTSLQIISDEAFSGTNFRTVFLDRQVVYIGDRVFSDMDSLKDIFIPESVEFIGRDAVPVCTVVHGVKGSSAQTWAEEHGRVFVIDDHWNAEAALTLPQGIRLLLMLAVLILTMTADAPKLSGIRRHLWASLRSMRPQDRPELYPINYRFP